MCQKKIILLVALEFHADEYQFFLHQKSLKSNKSNMSKIILASTMLNGILILPHTLWVF